MVLEAQPERVIPAWWSSRAAAAHRFYCPLSDTLLDPLLRVEFDKPAPAVITHALRHWGDRTIWVRRTKEHPELRCRRRTFLGPPPLEPLAPPTRRVAIVKPEPDDDRKPRGDLRALEHAALQCIVEHAHWITGLAGLWDGPRFVRPFSRHEWAARVGCTVKQWDRIVSNLKAAEYIARRQRRDKIKDRHGKVIGYRGRLATLLLTHTFWQLSGAWGLRQRDLGETAKEARKERQAAEPPREHPPHAPAPDAWKPLPAAEVLRVRKSWEDPPP